jgi:hypothetical protein
MNFRYTAGTLHQRGETMTLKRFAVLPFFLVVILSVYARQSSTAPTKSAQAVSILQNSVTTMASAIPSDSVASGSIQIVAGSLTTQGTIRVSTKGSAESLVQVTTPQATNTVIFSNGQANALAASAVSVLPLELVVTSQAPDFPLPLLIALLNDPDTSFQYVALESLNGVSLHHIQTSDSYASQPDLQTLTSFSTRDIWINAATGLPQRISYQQTAAHGAPSIAMDVFYSNYQQFSGVLYPLSIQKSMNGTPWATITIQNVSFNNGLTDADFPVQ